MCWLDNTIEEISGYIEPKKISLIDEAVVACWFLRECIEKNIACAEDIWDASKEKMDFKVIESEEIA